MKEESGRSLIEIIGVLAIGGVMAAASIAMYNNIRNNQIRTIANSKMETIAKNTKLLMKMRDSYEGVSVDYLVKAGAMSNADAPIGGKGWSVSPSIDNKSFMINLVDLTSGECAYFSGVIPKWATGVIVNGWNENTTSQCFSSATNRVSIVVQ